MSLAAEATNHPVIFFTGVVLGAVVVGLVVGLIPLAVGALTRQRPLGVKGFISCLIASLVGGALVAIPVAAVFCIYIVIKSRKGPDPDEPAKTS